MNREYLTPEFFKRKFLHHILQFLIEKGFLFAISGGNVPDGRKKWQKSIFYCKIIVIQ